MQNIDRRKKRWTPEEEELLCDWWGNHSVGSIAKKLNRSESAVINKVNKLGLPPFLESADDYVTLHQLADAVGYDGGQGYLHTSWVKNRGLPLHRIKRKNVTFQVVYIDEFWKWAKENQAFLNFSKFEMYALGPEPDWVKIKRKRDYQISQSIKTTPWTPIDDSRLKKYLSDNRYTYMELSKMLNRTAGAIQRRICDLNLTDRPVKANNHIKWTDQEWEQLGEMIKEGYNYETMSDVLGRSSKAIRGRVFDMYLTERLDKVRSYIGDGKWGDGRPEIPLRYMRVMSNDDKEEAKHQLSLIAGILIERAKSESGVAEEYKDYFQKDMCMHWDDVQGCLAGESGCDYCSSFQRIKPQHCTRCGVTFYERKQNKICLRCRQQRIKQAQRKYAVMQRRKK